MEHYWKDRLPTIIYGIVIILICCTIGMLFTFMTGKLHMQMMRSEITIMRGFYSKDERLKDEVKQIDNVTKLSEGLFENPIHAIHDSLYLNELEEELNIVTSKADEVIKISKED